MSDIRERWTDAEMILLLAHWDKMGDRELAAIIGRPEHGVQVKRVAMGLHRGRGGRPSRGRQRAGAEGSRIAKANHERRAPKPTGYTEAYVADCRLTAPPAELRLIEAMHAEGVLLLPERP